MKNLWESNLSGREAYPSLSEDIEADVCIVGGGITGVTAALQLSRAGKKVVLLEAGSLAFGTTGYSSNHLNTQIDYSYRNVEKNFSEEIARVVASSRTEAIDFIENNVKDFQIDCDFKRVDGFLYTESEDEMPDLENEFEASQRAGLAVRKTSETSLPFPVKMAVCYSGQAAFNAIKYILGIAPRITLSNGRIYENSRVTGLDKDKLTVKTQSGSVRAEKIFLATHIPLFINLHQTTSSPYRSYVIAVKVDKYPNDALYWDMFDPYHYTRIYEQNDQKWLIIGGADHKTGQSNPKKDYFRDLEAYASLRYNVTEVSHRWSHQYFEPSDGLPYIGLSPLGSTYIATGFSGDGLVYGTIAGMLVSDLIMGKENLWKKAYDSRRFKPVASAEEFIKHNIDVMKHLIADRFTSQEINHLKPDQGVVIRKNNNTYAVSKDSAGRLTVCSASCSHMGCIVHWNHMEKTWDCGCHGSLFGADGNLLYGPATKGLSKIDHEDSPFQK